MFWVAPRRRSSFSRPLRPPRPPVSRVVQTLPLPVRVEAGTPCFAQVARKVASVTSPVVTGQAVAGSASWEWSSSQDTISASVPSARCHGMKPGCHRWFGCSATNRMQDDFGSRVTRPARVRRRLIVAAGTVT